MDSMESILIGMLLCKRFVRLCLVLLIIFREYPVAPDRNGSPGDFANYPIWLSQLRGAFNNAGANYGLSITLPSSFWYLQNFDIVALEPLVDWFNMMGR